MFSVGFAVSETLGTLCGLHFKGTDSVGIPGYARFRAKHILELVQEQHRDLSEISRNALASSLCVSN